MEKKYELTDEILEVGGHVLHRIKALRDFGNVKKGDIGGWIECEDNLSHDDDCWVYGNATVRGDAIVEKNPTTSCSRIGGAAGDTSHGHARTICGVSDASTALAKNSSRRLITTVTRAVASINV